MSEGPSTSGGTEATSDKPALGLSGDAAESQSESTANPGSPTVPMGALVEAITTAFRQSVPSTSGNDIESPDSLRRSVLRPPRPYSIGQNFKTWLSQFSEYGSLVNIPGDKRRAFLMNSLDQQAYRAVQLLRIPVSSTYEEFLAALKKRFDTGKTTNDYKLLLKNRQQKPNEDVETYADNLLDLAENAYPSAEYEFKEEVAKDCFLDGVCCDATIREQLFVKQPKSLSEAVRHIRQLESARMASRNVSSNSKLTPNKAGHVSQVSEKTSEIDDLKSLLVKMNARLESLENQVVNKSRQESGGRDLSKVKCFSCQSFGHYARNCPYKRSGN